MFCIFGKICNIILVFEESAYDLDFCLVSKLFAKDLLIDLKLVLGFIKLL